MTEEVRRPGGRPTDTTSRTLIDPNVAGGGDEAKPAGFNPRAFRRSLRRAGITTTQHLVAVELCEYAGPDRPVVWPSIARLAEDCGTSERTVIRALNQLAAAGFIVCDRGRKGGRGCSTRWRLVVNPDTSVTVLPSETLTPVTETLTPVTENPDTGVTRSSKGSREEGGAAHAARPAPPASATDSPPISCYDHQPNGIEDCKDCDRAWRKHENWEENHPQSWAEFAAGSPLDNHPAEWLDQGPPRFCDRGHPTGNPCGACGQLRLMRKEWDQHRAEYEEDRQYRRKEIAACHMCDRAGRVWVGGDPDPWWCDHGRWGEPLDSLGTVSSAPPGVTFMDGQMKIR